MIDLNLLDSIQNTLSHLKKPVRLILFTRDIGCETCTTALDLARAIKARTPKAALEVYDQVMDRDKAEQYGIQHVPAFVVQDGNGRFVTFHGLVHDVFLRILLDTVIAISGNKVWFPQNIRSTLDHLEKDVIVQVFVEADCEQCRPVAETAIGLALESDLVAADIIIASDFPELIKRYSIKALPKTVFGANLHMDGHVSESEFLEMIFQAEGVQAGPERRCLVCGKSSPDVICSSCKTRIQAEAVDHKRKGEKIRQDAL